MGSAPYIIFGPPGTGKTVTIVEAVKQIHKLQPDSHILVCAPSNSVADIVVHRLLEHIPKGHMFRMHAQSRSISTIPQDLLKVSNISNGYIYFPTVKTLKTYRIIITTFITASRIASACQPPGHITHVFMDESGHSMEPEAMAALAGVVSKATQVILAGDPHQLGPVIRNPQCHSSKDLFKGNGLDKSYLERLMEMPMYGNAEGHYNPQVVTKLLHNYRSHPSILKIPNELFYDSELKASANQLVVNAFCQWEHLPKKNFPLIFHAVKGSDQREGNSPSFFNTLEVSTVMSYVKKLLESKNPRVLPKEIGIITPYRKQVEKIRSQVQKLNGSKDLKVGSTEEFQGDERRVIIISTVRASADKLAMDEYFKLGFLRNEKRFNVAVTRAKGLLIVVGCPKILALDKQWGHLLEYIVANGGYIGRPYGTNDGADLEDIIKRFDSIDLRPVIYEGVGMRQLVEAPEWRGED